MKSLLYTKYNPQIEKVLDKIEYSLEEDLCIERLASLSGYSQFHFQRIFKEYIGESIAQYIKRMRVEKTALMLKYQYNNITDAAIRTGFNSNTSLTRAFKSIYNLSPQEYKQRYRHFNDTLETPSFKITNIKDFKVFFVRCCGDYDYSEPKAWIDFENTFQYIPQDNCKYISICYNEPSITLNPSNLRYEACILYEEQKHYHIKNLPLKNIKGGTYAKFSFEGNMAGFNNYFNIIFDTFFHDRNYQVSLKPSFQVHLNSYKELLKDEIKTELYIPID